MKITKELQKAVEECKQGNFESFHVIYKQSWRYLYSCIMHIVKDENAVMDILQETYLEIYRSISQLKDTEKFLSWSAVIANHKCSAYMRKIRDFRLIGKLTESSFYSHPEEEVFIPENILLDREESRLIRQIVDGLPDRQRLCVIGFYFHGEKQEEIAERLGIPLNTVKSHLRRARANIKKAILYMEKNFGTRLYMTIPFAILFFRMQKECCEPVTECQDLMMGGNAITEVCGMMHPKGGYSLFHESDRLPKEQSMEPETKSEYSIENLFESCINRKDQGQIQVWNRAVFQQSSFIKEQFQEAGTSDTGRVLSKKYYKDRNILFLRIYYSEK